MVAITFANTITAITINITMLINIRIVVALGLFIASILIISNHRSEGHSVSRYASDPKCETSFQREPQS